MRIPTMAGALVLALAAGASAQPVADTAESAAVEAVAPAPDDGRLLAWTPGGTSIVLSLMLRERVEAVSGFDVDRYGTRFEPDPVADGTVRIGAQFDSRLAWAPVGLGVTYEHDLHFFLRRITLDRLLYGTPAEHRRWLAAMEIDREHAA